VGVLLEEAVLRSLEADLRADHGTP
jgi:hypothetical protein